MQKAACVDLGQQRIEGDPQAAGRHVEVVRKLAYEVVERPRGTRGGRMERLRARGDRHLWRVKRSVAAKHNRVLHAAGRYSSGLVSCTFGEIAITPFSALPVTLKVEKTPSPLRSPFAVATNPPLTADVDGVAW
jgi:hypothetical protein